MDFLTQIQTRTGLPSAVMNTGQVTQFLNNSIIDILNKVKAVNPDAYSRLAVKTEVDANGTTLIDGDIVAVYGTSVHEGTYVSSTTSLSGGSGYSEAPTVTFVGGGGSGGTGTTALAGDAVTSITITEGGTGYTTIPTVVFSDGNATATAVLNSAATFKRPATEVSFELTDLAKDPNSIHYQSKYNPVWFRDGRNIGIIPNGGTILHIGIPTTAHDSDSVLNLPVQFQNAMVIGAAAQTIARYIQRFTIDNKPVYATATIPPPPSFSSVMPDDLVAPSFAWTATSLQDEFGGQSIDTTLINQNFPSYTAPSLDIPTLISIGDLTLPDPPSVPGAISQELGFTDSVPTFSPPAMVIIDFPTIADFELTATLPSPPLAPSLSAENITETTIDSLPAPPVYASPKILGTVQELMPDAIGATVSVAEDDAQSITKLLEAAWSYISEEEDTEMASSVTGFIGSVQSLYSAAITDADKHYQQQVGEYQSQIARQMENARFDQTSAHKQNDADWGAKVAQYEKELSHHSAEMARYQADVSTQTSEWQLQNLTYEIAAWSQKQDKKFAEYDKAMAAAMNSFTNDMSIYEKNFLLASKELEVSDKNLASTLISFDKELARYNAEVTATGNKYQQDEILKKWEKYKFEYDQSLSKFGAEVASNMNTFNEQNTKLSTELTIAQANASNIQSALMNQMQTNTELAKNNEAQRLAMDLQTFTQEMATFNTNMSKYSAEVTVESGKFTVAMSEATNKMNDNQTKFNTEFQTYQNEQVSWEKLLGILKQEYAEAVGIMIPKKGE